MGDLNADGLADLVVALNSDQLQSNGPGYVVLSRNGRTILDNPAVIRLPNGLYGTNTKNNFAGIRDLNGDGRGDIVICQTRNSPYYEGRVLQILMSRSDGTFVDETATRIDNSLRFGSDVQLGHIGEFGEGEITFVDVNADGHIDIVDQNSHYPITQPGSTIFLNDGTGRFTVASASNLPFVPPYALAGFEPHQTLSPARFLPRAIPIDLDKQLGIDFVSFVLSPANAFGHASESSFYTIRSLKPLAIANTPPVIVTQPVSQAVGAFGTATLSVTATGNPAPTYQWKFNGADLPGQNHAKLFQSTVGPTRNGTYTVVVSNPSGSVTSAPATLSVDPQGAAFINLHPTPQIVDQGADVTFTADTNGTAMQWYHNDVAIPAATTKTLTLRSVQPGDLGAYALGATRGTTAVKSNPGRLTIRSTSGAPAIIVQPTSDMIIPGGPQLLAMGATGTLPLTYQWRKNGSVIPGATGPVLVFSNSTNADAGTYTVTVSNALGSVTSREANLSAYNPGRIINLSILTDITAEAPTFTVGTVVGGVGVSGAKPLLIRAVGPSLAPLGVANSLPNAKLEVFSGANVTASNDDWAGAANIASLGAQVGAFGFTSGTSLDAAVAFSPTPGSYTVQVSGLGGATGNVLAEVYDATPGGAFLPATPVLINVSVLKQIDADAVLTAGFVIGGTTPKQVLIRAIGPTLGTAVFGIPGAMSDTKIELFDAGSRILATNDNWGGGAALAAAFTSVGAFGLAADSRDAVVLARLSPGSYTAQVSGVAGSAGLALVEVYEVP